MNLELDDYMVEGIVSKRLLESISICYNEIVELADSDSLQDYEVRDIRDSIDYIVALMKVYSYYNADTSVLDKYQPDVELSLKILRHTS